MPEVWTAREGGERIQFERGEDGELYGPEGVTSGWVDPGSLRRIEIPIAPRRKKAPPTTS
jgi:hypothetical protein